MPSATPTAISALSSLIQSRPPQEAHSAIYHNLALQVGHNLQYQQGWTEVYTRTISPLLNRPLPRPLISGLPPHRIYVHPDDQVEELKRAVKDEEIEVEREWVLPTNLKEKWSLKRFAEIFDAIGEEPPSTEEGFKDNQKEDNVESLKKSTGRRKRRGGKRLLLATVGDDSTVVYYIVHDGIVKPRQN